MTKQIKGTAAAIRSEKVEAASVIKVGDAVLSVYGWRKVVKVNAKSIGLEGSVAGNIKLEKHLIIKHVAA